MGVSDDPIWYGLACVEGPIFFINWIHFASLFLEVRTRNSIAVFVYFLLEFVVEFLYLFLFVWKKKRNSSDAITITIYRKYCYRIHIWRTSFQKLLEHNRSLSLNWEARKNRCFVNIFVCLSWIHIWNGWLLAKQALTIYRWFVPSFQNVNQNQ